MDKTHLFLLIWCGFLTIVTGYLLGHIDAMEGDIGRLARGWKAFSADVKKNVCILDKRIKNIEEKK
jgi:hypothetical protein